MEDLSGPLQRPEERARVHLCDRVEGELERRDDRKAASAAAQGPEQVVLALGVGADYPAVRGHRLDGEDAVAREAVAARQPADPTAERVADHADVLGRARQRRQPLLGRGGHDLAPERAGPDAGPFGPRVDLDAAHARGLDEDRPQAAPSARRCGPFPAAQSRNPRAPASSTTAAMSSEASGDDRDRTLVDGEVPRLPCGVPAAVAR